VASPTDALPLAVVLTPRQLAIVHRIYVTALEGRAHGSDELGKFFGITTQMVKLHLVRIFFRLGYYGAGARHATVTRYAREQMQGTAVFGGG
jgi:hypothetical protein